MADWDGRLQHLLIFKNKLRSNKEQQTFSRQAKPKLITTISRCFPPPLCDFSILYCTVH